MFVRFSNPSICVIPLLEIYNCSNFNNLPSPSILVSLLLCTVNVSRFDKLSRFSSFASLFLPICSSLKFVNLSRFSNTCKAKQNSCKVNLKKYVPIFIHYFKICIHCLHEFYYLPTLIAPIAGVHLNSQFLKFYLHTGKVSSSSLTHLNFRSF